MKTLQMKKSTSLLLITLIYAVGFVGSYFLTTLFKFNNPIHFVLVWDVFSTIFVYIFSLVFHNSSVYDPYWSVVPPIVAIYLMIQYKAYSVMHFIVLAGILFWALRLTINWIKVMDGFRYEDWRYKMFRDKSKNWFEWFIYNFFGIHLVPTLFVFFAMLPFFVIFSVELNYFSLFGVVVIILGTLLELFADKNMHYFLKVTTEKKVCNYGLWKYSRHPNYLGEITFWVGVYLVMIISYQSNFYYFGFLGIVFMFNVISIPMMEKRQKTRRSDYVQYIKTTHRLLLLPNKQHK